MKCKRCGSKLIHDSEYSKHYHGDISKCFSCGRRYNSTGEMVSPPYELNKPDVKAVSIFKNI